MATLQTTGYCQSGSWTAYSAVPITAGNVYELEANVTTTNAGDNGLFSIAFATSMVSKAAKPS